MITQLASCRSWNHVSGPAFLMMIHYCCMSSKPSLIRRVNGPLHKTAVYGVARVQNMAAIHAFLKELLLFTDCHYRMEAL